MRLVLWKVATKRGLARKDFKVDARQLRRGRLDNGYSELPIVSDQVVATEGLPRIHKDPFDQILVAQATVEGVTPLTIDFSADADQSVCSESPNR